MRHALLPSLLAWLCMCGVVQAESFLLPNQAFRLAAQAAPDGRLTLHVAVAPGHYMYREAFRVKDDVGQLLGIEVLTPSERKYDPTFEREMEIHREAVRITVPMTAATRSLFVTGQGCADRGLCYAPMTSALTPDRSRPGQWRLDPGPDPEGEFGVGPSPDRSLAPVPMRSQRPRLKLLAGVFLGLAGLLLSSRRY